MTVVISEQILNFAYSLLIGAALGVLYDFFKIIRLLGLKSTLLVFFEDILFFLISTLTVFALYMQKNDGKFRIYIFLSVCLGFLIYSLTVEKAVFFVVKKCFEFVNRIIDFVLKKAIIPLGKRISSAISVPFAKIGGFIKKNICKFLKKLLPKLKGLLYNVLGISKNRKGKKNDAEKRHQESKKAFYC